MLIPTLDSLFLSASADTLISHKCPVSFAIKSNEKAKTMQMEISTDKQWRLHDQKKEEESETIKVTRFLSNLGPALLSMIFSGNGSRRKGVVRVFIGVGMLSNKACESAKKQRTIT